MQWIAVPMVLGVEDWLAEELPEVRRFDDSTHGSLVLCDVAGDREWEFTGDDEFGQLGAPGTRISAHCANDLTI
jgi:hypothetical protein